RVRDRQRLDRGCNQRGQSEHGRGSVDRERQHLDRLAVDDPGALGAQAAERHDRLRRADAQSVDRERQYHDRAAITLRERAKRRAVTREATALVRMRIRRGLPQSSGSRTDRINASMWRMYSSSAPRPDSVRRYSVRGTRPSKVLVHVMYDASSSLRACTLRLPSVVSRSAFSSLNVRDSLTARALTMPSRMR